MSSGADRSWSTLKAIWKEEMIMQGRGTAMTKRLSIRSKPSGMAFTFLAMNPARMKSSSRMESWITVMTLSPSLSIV